MRIKVTEEDIAEGTRCCNTSCPVANAALRTSRESTVSCGTASIRIGDRRYILPDSVGARIKRFDETGIMEPFEFELTCILK